MREFAALAAITTGTSTELVGPNPSGLCLCGCGQRTSLAQQTHRALGYVKGEPVRYVRWHRPRVPRRECACGCGGLVKDLRARWIKGHNLRSWDMEPSNPSGLCMCGCGQPTRPAVITRKDRGEVKGQPVRYVFGHYGRVPDPVLDTETGCLLYQGYVDSSGRARGGRQSPTGKSLPYQLAWEVVHGPIPEGMHIHHACGDPRCVSVDHLTLISPQEHAAIHSGPEHSARVKAALATRR